MTVEIVTSSDISGLICEVGERLENFSSLVGRLSPQQLSAATLAFQDGSEKVVAQLMLEAGFRAERVCPYSARAAIQLVLGHSRKFSGVRSVYTAEGLEEFLSDVTRKIAHVRGASFFPNASEFWDVVSSHASHRALGVLRDAISLGGFDSRYVIERSSSPNPDVTVETVLGYNFSLDSAVNIDSWEAENVSLLMVDGVIESVTEIHRVLTFAAEKKVPIVIVARSFADDVRQTIVTNNARRSFSVLPIVVPADARNINTIRDISIVCGSSVVSSITGEVLSGKTGESLISVNAVRFLRGNLTIVGGERTAAATDAHRCSLVESRQEAHHEMLPHFDSRIKSLTPNHVLVRVPSRGLEDSGLFDDITDVFRLVRAIHEYGVHIDENGDIDVTLRALSALRFAKAQLKLLFSLGAIVVN